MHKCATRVSFSLGYTDSFIEGAGAATDDGTPLSAKMTVVMEFSIHCFDSYNHLHKTCFMQVFFNKGA